MSLFVFRLKRECLTEKVRLRQKIMKLFLHIMSSFIHCTNVIIILKATCMILNLNLSFNFTLAAGKVFVPNFCIVDNSDPEVAFNRLLKADVRFPVGKS